jgi:transketolase
LAAGDDSIWLIAGDLGYSVLDPFVQRFPERFVNAGVAEQNMTGVAAGLAMCGKTVFTYSIANFPTMRCLEQIRNDVCHHNANVKIVSVGAGLTYGAQGYTHHGLEDVAVMRLLPNMVVMAPADPTESRLATLAIARHSGPCYLRLGGTGEPVLYDAQPDLRIGHAITLREGKHVTLLSSGGLLKITLEAADMLGAANIRAGVLSFPTVKPIDENAILSAARTTRCIVTVEEHSLIGGFGSAVAEVLAGSDLDGVAFSPMGIPEGPTGVGDRQYLHEKAGLTPQSIVDRVYQLLKNRKTIPELSG